MATAQIRTECKHIGMGEALTSIPRIPYTGSASIRGCLWGLSESFSSSPGQNSLRQRGHGLVRATPMLDLETNMEHLCSRVLGPPHNPHLPCAQKAESRKSC